MRIVQINQQDIGGGGFIVPFRLHQAFRRLGHESYLVVISKLSSDPYVVSLIRPNLMAKVLWRVFDVCNSFELMRYRRKPCYGWVNHNVLTWAPAIINRLKPDVIDLNFFNCMLGSSQVAKLKVPLFWTFHDMSPFTGGCHCTPTCIRYRDGCGKCPELGSDVENDISRREHQKRRRIWSNKIIGIAQSRWLEKEAKSSSLCQDQQLEMIHNGVPLDVFSPSLRDSARRQFGFINNKFYVLAGSAANANPLKGMKFVKEAAKILGAQYAKKVVFVTFGATPSDIQGVELLHMGYLNTDAALADLYAACDVYVLPTLLDSLPTTLIESIACGTPAITFDIGGCVDIIENGVNGFVVRDHTGLAIATHIEQFIRMPSHAVEDFRRSARRVAEEKFDIMDMAERYLEIYRSVPRSKEASKNGKTR